jgi:hypothetical protein
MLTGALALLAAAACETDSITYVGEEPAEPLNVAAEYYAGVVTVTWELAPGWNGEAFRVYSRRTTDPDFFFVAEVTSCIDGFCLYTDANIVAEVVYEYYVSAVDPESGLETASQYTAEVFVPDATPPPDPTGTQVVALDGANYIRWQDNARAASGFSFYRVYLFESGGSEFLLGETDSEGFLDEIAANGVTSSYFVTAVDIYGHESFGAIVAAGTPRPDFRGEWIDNHFDKPETSGFRFQEDENVRAILPGASASMHFRLEVDAAGWWLVPGVGTGIYPVAFETTDLKCGVAADASCEDVPVAPETGYSGADMALEPLRSYVLRVLGDDNELHYGVIRVEMLGFDQDDNALMIFDWAYQLQAGNPDLAVKRGG